MQQEADLPDIQASKDEFLKIEQRGLEPVPETEQHGSAGDLFFVWAGAMSNYVSLLTGALVIGAPLTIGLAQGQLGFLDCAIAILLGSLLGSLLHGLMNVTGARTGTPQMIFARAIFGHRGAYISAALTWIMAIGWFAIDCIIGGWALVQLLSLCGVPKTVPVTLWSLTFVLLASIIVAIYGHQTVHIFEKYGSIVFMIFCILLFAVLFPKIHWQLPTTVQGSARSAALVTGGSFIYALVASWIPFASDYSRYMPRRIANKRVAWWSGLGIGLPTALLGILGIALYTINPNNPDLLSTITAATPPWLTIPFLLFVVLGEIWANYFDVYTAGLVALAMDIPLRRWVSALICGIVGGCCMYFISLYTHINQARTYTDLTTNFLGFYEDFLLLTYLWVPAWTAVLLVDFFLLRHGHYQEQDFTRGRTGSYWYHKGFFWRAISAWLIGFVVTIPFIGSATLPWMAHTWQGPFAHLLGGADISGIVGAIVSGILYYLFGRTFFTKQMALASQQKSSEVEIEEKING